MCHITINLSEEEARDPAELWPATQRNSGRNTQERGGTSGTQRYNNQPAGKDETILTLLWAEGVGEVAGGVREEGENRGDEGNGGEDDAEEINAARSFVFFPRRWRRRRRRQRSPGLLLSFER